MKRYSILSVGVDSLDEQEFLAHAKDILVGSRLAHVVTVNPEFIMEAQGNERFRNVLNKATLALADGFGLHCAALILFSKKVFHRITGVQATLLLCELAAQLGKSVYLIGGREGVARRTADALHERYPALAIAGAEEGLPFGAAERASEHTSELLSRITTSKPDILFVAFGAPKQELWIADNLSALLGVKIAMGVGGTFDYLSGAVPFAPRLVRSIGLEWLYRLIREPRRLNRIITATIRFPAAVLFSKMKGPWRMRQGQ